VWRVTEFGGLGAETTGKCLAEMRGGHGATPGAQGELQRSRAVVCGQAEGSCEGRAVRWAVTGRSVLYGLAIGGALA
jgi:hypothetical protein